MGPEAPVHILVIEADNSNPLHFTLHIKATVPIGETLPALPSGAKFKIECADEDSEGLTELESKLIDTPEGHVMEADFLLDINFLDANTPWGYGFAHGYRFDVKLSIEANTIAAMRQLHAI
ncbi:uncharacterized protein BP5553_09435 [Venustampulla echinocandica]|uniref:Uncharacterized protein n=1 Tax=Venustampulla echinocandica TaxID=2656787 RepID=A0A370TCQ4_9HELO|nr:uncharacterized protein BP5553_09435 [Venustampulla echinocandica]RDL32033.1 hypothetical protein BP5553_09435 [Venustampulla echinocandica]